LEALGIPLEMPEKALRTVLFSLRRECQRVSALFLETYPDQLQVNLSRRSSENHSSPFQRNHFTCSEKPAWFRVVGIPNTQLLPLFFVFASGSEHAPLAPSRDSIALLPLLKPSCEMIGLL